MQKVLLLIVCLLMLSLVNAQKYTTAAGVRIGSGFGVTLQQRLWNNYTAEAILQKSMFNSKTYGSVLFEQHFKILSKGLNFYAGAGPHVSISRFNATNNKIDEPVAYTSTGFGVSAIGGLEMKFRKIVLSIDYLPSVNIVGNESFESRTGISARYIFVKAKKKKKEENWKFWKKWKAKRQAEEAEWN